MRAPGACTFDSITAARTAAHASHAATRTIHVAPGIYDATTETFPIDLRDGISLVGMGADPAAVLVQGSGVLDHSAEGGTLGQDPNPPIFVEIITGTQTGVSQISNLRLNSDTITSNDAGAGRHAFGIVCDRGNAVPPGQTQPAPNLIIDHVIFEPGFGAAVAASGSSNPSSGCNLRVTSSTFTGQAPYRATWIGVESITCPHGPKDVYSAFEVGDGDVRHGNTFTGMAKGDGTTGGVFIEQCTASVIVHGNLFEGGESGVVLIDAFESAQPGVRYSIADNVFHGQSVAGVFFYDGAMLAELNGNKFTSCNKGVWVTNRWSSVVSARGNSFVGNNVGVDLWSGTVGVPLYGVFDFGTNAGAGGNTFRCNSSLNRTDAGGDFIVESAIDAGAVTLHGDVWDHAPPTTSSTASDGVDILLPPGGNEPVTGGDTADPSPCGDGHIP